MKFDQPLHVGRPIVGDVDRFHQLSDGMFERNWLTNNGELVRQLEEDVAEYLGVRNCVAVSSGTMALMLAARAVGLSGEVVVPSFTFIATAHALSWLGIQPVFCDVCPDTLCVDPVEVEKLITPRTSGIIGVHLFGQTCDVPKLSQIAAEHDLRLVFDAAHAFGCSAEAIKVGGFGDCEAFSFHATKVFHTFEGGAVTTNDDELAEKVRLMRDFGYNDHDQVVGIGINGKMSEVHAAMGLANLGGIDDVFMANKERFERYRAGAMDIPGIRMIMPPDNGNYHYINLEICEEFSILRDEVLGALKEENVLAKRYFWPGCHRHEPYENALSGGGRLPVTERVLDRIIQLPSGPNVSLEDIDRILDFLWELSGAKELG